MGCEHFLVQRLSRNLNGGYCGLHWSNSFSLLTARPPLKMHIQDVDATVVLSEDEALSDIVPALWYIMARDFVLAMGPTHTRSFSEKTTFFLIIFWHQLLHGVLTSQMQNFVFCPCWTSVEVSEWTFRGRWEKKYAKIKAGEKKQRKDKRKYFGRQKSRKIIKIWMKRKWKKPIHFCGCCLILHFHFRNISDLGNREKKWFPCYISNPTFFSCNFWIKQCGKVCTMPQESEATASSLMESVKCKSIFIKVMHFSASSSVQLWHFSICISC